MGGKAAAGKGRRGRRERALRSAALFDEHYPGADCALTFSNPFELLVATVLSAQCTDARVNMVTPALFARYRTITDYAGADPATFMEEIRSTGFFRNKASNIIAAARQIEERFGGRVPETLEELVSLPGIGRKTANVILRNVFSTPGIVVDTHVQRVSRRLGLTSEKDPVKIEFDLMELLPRSDWSDFTLRLVYFGREYCRARKPRCPECPIANLCPYPDKVDLNAT